MPLAVLPMSKEPSLSVSFRGNTLQVTFPSCIPRKVAKQALESEPFRKWLQTCQATGLQLDSPIELQSVDMFGPRVGFVKLKSCAKVKDSDAPLPGICLLRGNSVAILVALVCDDDKVYSLLVEQPRVPIGQASFLELPAGMMDGQGGVASIAIQEMKEECGIQVKANELIDLTLLAHEQDVGDGPTGVALSPGGCDEFVQIMYLEKNITREELEAMKGRLAGLRNHGELITLRVVPFDEIWKVSSDAKAMCALFLLDKLREQGKVPLLGELATPLASAGEPKLQMRNGTSIPQLAFGLYKVSASDEGEQVILDAIHAGYRHFDTASFYRNEATLGRALKKSGLPRECFFITSKVWNDAQTKGRPAVRKSVQESLTALDFGGYFDLFLIHWPVPGRFVETYKELEMLHKEGKLHNLGLSNFSPQEYEELVEGGINVPPVVNQLEVSPILYQKSVIDYFKSQNVLISAYKPLNRGANFGSEPLPQLAAQYEKSEAQIMLRWSLQRGLIVVAKTATASRMHENRDMFDFSLTDDEMMQLDTLTTSECVHEREQNKLAFMQKTSK